MPGGAPLYPPKKPFKGDPPGVRGPLKPSAPDNQQVFKAWDRLMHAFGDYAPKQLNRATFYRARLDNIVR